MVADKAALAAATPCLGAAARLQVAVPNEAAMARAAPADGAAISLAVWVLDKAAVACLRECGKASQKAG
jgi:hypothetical protein